MDLLKGWIGPRVHQALSEALEWKAQGSPATKDGQEAKFEDDGNSLRVKSSKKEYVQISKVWIRLEGQGIPTEDCRRSKTMQDLSSYGYLIRRHS